MSFATPKDRVYQLQLASPYVAGSGSMVLQSGQGAAFTTFPIYFAAITLQSYGTGKSEVTASYTATGITTDTLTGVAVLGGSTDQNFGVGDYVEERAVAQYILDLNAAVTTLQADFPVSNANLQNSSITIANGSGISGGGTVALGGTLTLSATGFSPGGTAGQIEYNNSGAFGGFTMSGDATIVTSTGVLTVSAGAITLAKQANFAASSLMGNPTGSSATPSAITLGANLSFVGTTLVASGSGGGTITLTGDTTGSGTSTIATTTGSIGGQAVTLGGALTVSGAFTTTLTVTANTSVTLPTSGTLVNTAVTTLSSLVSVGTITTGVWNGTGIDVAHGGSGAATLTPHAVLLGEGTSTLGFATIGTAGRVLVNQGAAAAAFKAISGERLGDPAFKAISGDATLSSAGALTVGAGTITLAKQANFAASSLQGNPTGSPAAPSAITLGANLSFSGTTLVASGGGTPGGTTGQIEYNNGGAFGGFTMSGDATIVTSTGVITIGAGAVTLAKQANFAASSLMGNPTGSSATPSAITLGSGLSFSGTTLVASGGSGTVTTVTNTPHNGVTIGITNPTTTPNLTATLGNITPTQVTIQSGGGVNLFSLNAATAQAPQTGAVGQFVGPDGVASRAEVDAIGAAAFLSLVRSGGVSGTLSALTSGTEIGGANAWGYNGTSVVGPRAGVGFFANENWSGTNQGTYTQLTATPNGSTTQAQVLQANGSGGILIPGSVTGGDMGAGTVNAAGYFVSGLPTSRVLFSCGACTAVTASTSTSLLGSPANTAGSLTLPTNLLFYIGQKLKFNFDGVLSTGGAGPTPQMAIILGSTTVGVLTFTGVLANSLTSKNWGMAWMTMMVTAIGASGAVTLVGQIIVTSGSNTVSSGFFAPGAAGSGTPVTIDTTASQLFDMKITIGATGHSFQVLTANLSTE